MSALAFRFGLIFFLARYLPAVEVGTYGLLAVTISYAAFVFGFDFYTYSTREIIREEPKHWRRFLRSQLALSGRLYATAGPLLLLLFAFGLLPWSLAPWFAVLLPLEHLGQELDRLLIAMNDQMGASLGLFIRQGLAPLLVIPVLALVPELRSLETALTGWLLCDVLGVGAGIWFLTSHLRGTPKGHVDRAWIRKGVRIAAPFLLGTLCLRALFTMDRQVVAHFADLETLGAYTVFASVSGGMTQVLYAGVQQFAYPRLVKAAHQNDREAYMANLRSLAVRSVVAVAGITLAVIIAQPLILRFIGGGVYEEYVWMLPWVMLVAAIYNLSLVPHYGLYALDADRAIVVATVAAFGVFALIIALFARAAPVTAVLVAVGSASAILLVAKLVVLARRLMARDERLRTI